MQKDILIKNAAEQFEDKQIDDYMPDTSTTIIPKNNFESKASEQAGEVKKWIEDHAEDPGSRSTLNLPFDIGEVGVSNIGAETSLTEQKKWNDVLDMQLLRWKTEKARRVYGFAGTTFELLISMYVAQGGNFTKRGTSDIWEKYFAVSPTGINLSSLEVSDGCDQTEEGNPTHCIHYAGFFSNENPKNIEWSYLIEESFQWLAVQGLRYIRLPIRWERLQPSFGNPFTHNAYSTAYRDKITQYFNWAHANGMKVLIEPHNFGIYKKFKTDVNTAPDLLKLSDTGMEANYQDLINRVITEWSGHPAWDGIDLHNEPAGVANTPAAGEEGNDTHQAIWEGIAARTVISVRNAGYTGYISVPAGYFSGAHSISKLHPNGKFWDDPLNNSGLQCHLYSNNLGRYGHWDGTFTHSGNDIPTSFAEELAATDSGWSGKGKFTTSDGTVIMPDSEHVGAIKREIPLATRQELKEGSEDEYRFINPRLLKKGVEDITGSAGTPLDITVIDSKTMGAVDTSYSELAETIATAGSDYVVVGVACRQVNEVGAVTVGGEALSLLSVKYNPSEVCGFAWYGLANPTASASAEVKVTMSGQARYISGKVLTLKNVEGAEELWTKESHGTAIHQNITTNYDKEMLLGGMEMKLDRTITFEAGQSELYTQHNTVEWAGVASATNRIVSEAGAVDFGFTADSAENYAVSVIGLIPKRTKSKYIKLTANKTITTSEEGTIFNMTAGSTVTLPVGAAEGFTYTIKNSKPSGTVVVEGTIDGATNATLTTNQAIRVINDGTNWIII